MDRRLLLAIPAALTLVPGAVTLGQDARLGRFTRQVDGLHEPNGVTVAGDGTILVVEPDEDAVRRLDAEGNTLDLWRPVVDGLPVVAPFGVAVTDAAIFITDRGHARVAVLDRDGAPRWAWGGHGVAPGQFDRPAGIAAAGDTVVVADSGNDRVQVFRPDGTLVMNIGGTGTRPGRLLRPTGVAIDDAGLIYVADTDNHRIQVFDADGNPVRSWGERGSFPGLMTGPSGVAVRGERVYVADGLGHRVQVFDRDGTFEYQWGMHAVVPREGKGRIHYPSGIAISPDGGLAVVAEAFENRVQIFGPLASGEEPPGGTLPEGLAEQAHFGPLLASGGPMLAVWEPPSQSISVFDVSRDEVPILITSFGEPGRRFGQIARPEAMLLSGDGRWLDVSDAGAGRLQRFRIDARLDEPVRYDPFLTRFAKSWDLDVLNGERPRPELVAMAWTADEHLIAIDRRTNELVEYDRNMRPTRRLAGDLLGPTDLVLDRSGRRILVADAWARRIVVLDRDGATLARWEHDGFRRPAALVVARNGDVYVSDAAADRIFRLDGVSGEAVTDWGGTGAEHGQFWKPGRIVQDQRGRLVVVDYGNHRMQIFDTDGNWQVTFGAGRAITKK